MIGYRCKCGELMAWSSMGVPQCVVCEKCGTTLANHPDHHLTEPEPHQWETRWEIDHKTGERWQERSCLRCMTKERIEPVAPPTGETSA